MLVPEAISLPLGTSGLFVHRGALIQGSSIGGGSIGGTRLVDIAVAVVLPALFQWSRRLWDGTIDSNVDGVDGAPNARGFWTPWGCRVVQTVWKVASYGGAGDSNFINEDFKWQD